MARSMASHRVRDQGKKANGTATAATAAPTDTASIGGSGHVKLTPSSSTSTTAVWATQMLMNHEPSHWPGTRPNTSPHLGQRGAIRTHARNSRPWPQTGQRRMAPRRSRVEVGTGTTPLCKVQRDPASPSTVAWGVVSDPTGTEVSAREPVAGRAVARVPAPPSARADTSALAARFRTLADDDFAGYCPIYDRIARAIADDEASLALLLDAAPVGRTPVLALAAVHDLVLADPGGDLATIYDGRSAADPWPAFRRLLHGQAPAVLRRMRTRTIQTNEVGRSAALLPALSWVRADGGAAADDRPLALVEVGPSAGLNLLLDRYAVTYRRGGQVTATAGDPASPVRLACELRGPADPPLDHLPAPIAARVGLDVAPVDVTDDEACRWLRACVWPGVPDRPERLAAALEVARRNPPRLVTGDAVTDLAPLVAGLPDGVLPVVIATWALAYLGGDGRAALVGALDELGATRDLVLVTAEEPRITPWVPEAPVEAVTGDAGGAGGEGTPTVLGARCWRAGQVTDDVLALCHPHVRWMAWTASPTAGEERR